MDESTLLYGLLIATTINTALLLVLAIVLIRLLLTLNGLIHKLESFIEFGQSELLKTLEVARRALSQSGEFLGKGAQVLERYVLLSSVNRLTSSSRLGKIITAMSFGYGLSHQVRRYLQKKD